MFTQRLKLATSNLVHGLGLPRPVIISHPEKSGRDPELGISLKFGFPFNISATAEANDVKFGLQLGFAKTHRKIIPQEKWAWPSIREAPLNLGFPFNIFATAEACSDFKIGKQLGFAKTHHKIPPRIKKWA